MGDFKLSVEISIIDDKIKSFLQNEKQLNDDLWDPVECHVTLTKVSLRAKWYFDENFDMDQGNRADNEDSTHQDSTHNNHLENTAFLAEFQNFIVENFSVDPLEEILSTISFLRPSDKYFLIYVLAKKSNSNESRILCYVSFLIDNKTKLLGKKTAFFVGIRKTIDFAYAQRLTNDKYKWPKMTSLLIPFMENISTKLDCEYIFTVPLNNMYEILTTYYGFEPLTEFSNEEEVQIEKIREKLVINNRTPCALLLTDDLLTAVYKKLSV